MPAPRCAALLALGLLARAAMAAPFDWHLPPGFPQPAVPADNPMSAAKVLLGQRLFAEQRLSVSGRYSCASCHDPARQFADGRPRAIGATGGRTPRSAMPLINEAYNLSYGWLPGGARTLEEQMRQPLFNRHPVEMGLGGRERAVVAMLDADAAYREGFRAVFGSRTSIRHVIQAIAAYERTLIQGRSAFDAYVYGGEQAALSPAAQRGMALFFSSRLGCSGCHAGFNFSGAWHDRDGATGRAGFAEEALGSGPVRVPTLRNVALTAPYMHDGRYATLDAVLDHYEAVGHLPDSAHGGHRDPRLKRFRWAGAEREELKEFLMSLSEKP